LYDPARAGKLFLEVAVPVSAADSRTVVVMFLHLLLLFTLVPIVEIWILIRIGQAISPGPTIALIVLTGIVGAALARREGLRTLRRVNENLARGAVPAQELVEGLMILVAGVTLVTPGVITDALGFAILIPPVRRRLCRSLAGYFRRRTVIVQEPGAFGTSGDEEFIDVEYRVVTEENEGSDNTSS
jgi:UPF0716 protein FxsA